MCAHRLRRPGLIGLLVVALLLVTAVPAVAEYRSFTYNGVLLIGSTDDGYRDDFGQYSNSRSSTGSNTPYVSVAGRGWNSDGGWHLVWTSSTACNNCTFTGYIKTYRCGTSGGNCYYQNYVVAYHYWEHPAFGTDEMFTSHDGGASDYCWWYRDC